MTATSPSTTLEVSPWRRIHAIADSLERNFTLELVCQLQIALAAAPVPSPEEDVVRFINKHPKMVKRLLDDAKTRNKEAISLMLSTLSIECYGTKVPDMLMGMPGMVDATAEALVCSSDYFLQFAGASMMRRLSVVGGERLFRHRAAWPAFLAACKPGVEFGVRVMALNAMMNLAACKDLKSALARCPGFMQLMLDTSMERTNDESIIAALGVIGNVTNHEPNFKFAVEFPGLVDAMMQLAAKSKHPEILEGAVKTLANVAGAEPALKKKLIERQGLVNTLMLAGRDGTTSRLRVQGFRGLYNLAASDTSRPLMCKKKGLLDAVFVTLSTCHSPEVISEAVDLLGSLTQAHLPTWVAFDCDVALRTKAARVVLRARSSGETKATMLFLRSWFTVSLVENLYSQIFKGVLVRAA